MPTGETKYYIRENAHLKKLKKISYMAFLLQS